MPKFQEVTSAGVGQGVSEGILSSIKVTILLGSEEIDKLAPELPKGWEKAFQDLWVSAKSSFDAYIAIIGGDNGDEDFKSHANRSYQAMMNSVQDFLNYDEDLAKLMRVKIDRNARDIMSDVMSEAHFDNKDAVSSVSQLMQEFNSHHAKRSEVYKKRENAFKTLLKTLHDPWNLLVKNERGELNVQGASFLRFEEEDLQETYNEFMVEVIKLVKSQLYAIVDEQFELKAQLRNKYLTKITEPSSMKLLLVAELEYIKGGIDKFWREVVAEMPSVNRHIFDMDLFFSAVKMFISPELDSLSKQVNSYAAGLDLDGAGEDLVKHWKDTETVQDFLGNVSRRRLCLDRPAYIPKKRLPMRREEAAEMTDAEYETAIMKLIDEDVQETLKEGEEVRDFKTFDAFFGWVDQCNGYEEDWDPDYYRPYYEKYFSKMIL